MKKIVIAGGCFWGVEAYFKQIDGVITTKVGYANGTSENPTYEYVCKGISGYAEACYIEFDESVFDLEALLERFFRIINPTLLNRQGGDIGHQYRTGVYYMDESDLPTIKDYFLREQVKYDKPIVTEIEALVNFYDAEEYHQDYLTKNPNGYCHINLDA